MKQDLDRYLEESNLDGLLVLGPAMHNPAMAYFTGPVHVGWGVLALPRGGAGTLYAADMEREEAARSGYRVANLDWSTYAREAGQDIQEAMPIALEHILRDTGLVGRIQVAGLVDAGETLGVFRRLERRLPGLTVVDLDSTKSPLVRARVTKDSRELERIRRMGQVTVEVVGRVSDFLSSHSVRQGYLTDRQGHPLTIGDVKQRINLWLMQLGAENPEGTIFAIGRDAAVPHNVGDPKTPIPIGQPIIFDIYPCEAGGGYFYDFTRTWCLGHAPEAVAAAYADVQQAYRLGLGRVRAGVVARDVQREVCEFFEGHGHPSVLSTPQTQEGYVHSLGHGLGLEVHEPPNFRIPGEPPDTLEVGHVVTIEPGLYYPERGVAVRIEDTVWIGPDGPQVLAPFPMDLVLPIRRSRRAPTKSAVGRRTTRKSQAKPRTVQRSRRSG
jgi:Xaa-Pro aminopeptidase